MKLVARELTPVTTAWEARRAQYMWAAMMLIGGACWSISVVIERLSGSLPFAILVVAVVLVTLSLPGILQRGVDGKRSRGAIAAKATTLAGLVLFVMFNLFGVFVLAYWIDWGVTTEFDAAGRRWAQLLISVGLVGLALSLRIVAGGWLLRSVLAATGIGGLTVVAMGSPYIHLLSWQFALAFTWILLGVAAWPMANVPGSVKVGETREMASGSLS